MAFLPLPLPFPTFLGVGDGLFSESFSSIPSEDSTLWSKDSIVSSCSRTGREEEQEEEKGEVGVGEEAGRGEEADGEEVGEEKALEEGRAS